jgi:LuxR family transcriptional regulator, maltose regulon positive regulatory protein
MASIDNSGDSALAQQIGEANSMPILLTKLHRPSCGAGLERRTALLERLDRNYDRPLTLISAPAGYGKTTLASMWLQASDCASAWVSLDERDDDLLTFATYLVTAIEGVFPNLQLKTQALLQAPAAPSAATVARYLMNDLQQLTDRFILVLDDIHLLKERAIFDLFTELLRHPLPSTHLVLIGRRDPPLPIASLRARGQVTEIRARDLQFTPAETAQLMGQMLNRDIDDEIAAEWTEKTEGWVTGLRLAALSLLQKHQTDDLRIGVPGSLLYLQEYLLADLLAYLPPAKKEWLLRASLLDRFSAPLCEAACRSLRDGSQSDANAHGAELTGKEFLRWLHDDNLFLVTLDDQGEWFRLHHLFQSLLQNLAQEQLTPDEFASVRLRASAWCAEHGLLDEAIDYALTYGDPAAAAQMLVRHRYALMNAGRWRQLDRWLKRLPDDVVAQSLPLLSVQGYLAMQRTAPWEALAICQQAALLLAARSPQSADDQAAMAELAVLKSLQELTEGRFALAADNTRKSLEQLPAQALYIRAVATTHIGVAMQFAGEPEQCASTFRQALSAPGWSAGARAVLLNNFCIAQLMQGDLNGILETAGESLRFAEKSRLSELLSEARCHLGTAHYLRNEWEQAQPYLLALLKDPALIDSNYLSFGAFALALIQQGQGRQAEAEEVVATLGAHLKEMDYAQAHFVTTSFRVELALRRGAIAEARGLSAKIKPEDSLNRVHFYSLLLTQPKLLLAVGTPESLATARAKLDALNAMTSQMHLASTRIDVLAVLALVHDALHEEAAALDSLGIALGLAEPGGFARNFLDLGTPMANLLVRLRRRHEVAHSAILPYLARILAAFPAQAQSGSRTGSIPVVSGTLPRPPSLAVPLTGSESRILRLLATDMSPEEMAGQLSVSVTTVRTHIRSIYAKLDAHSRFEAVLRAKELGLL